MFRNEYRRNNIIGNEMYLLSHEVLLYWGGGRITFFRLPAILRKYNPDHSLSPTGYQIDLVTMIQDIAMGKSKTEVMKKK